MKIGLLSSSRADFGIYEPLLKEFQNNSNHNIEIIAFGMHILSTQGNTLEYLKNYNFLIHMIEGMPNKDSVEDIATGYGKILLNFASFWSRNYFDIIFVLGDRWEMSAAIQASIPFELKIAHIHGGEKTLGATDNIYRDQISLASKIHFTANQKFSDRVIELINSNKLVFNVGSLSISNIENECIPDWEIIKKKFKIPFNKFILFTLHPESIRSQRNKDFLRIINDSFKILLGENFKILITASNSDVYGSLYNKTFKKLSNDNPKEVKFVKSFGRLNYFSAVRKSSFLVGNTSSGIIESASFGKYFLNIGDRQKGRLQNNNVINVPFNSKMIVSEVKKISILGKFEGNNKYFKKHTAKKILDIINKIEIST